MYVMYYFSIVYVRKCNVMKITHVCMYVNRFFVCFTFDTYVGYVRLVCYARGVCTLCTLCMYVRNVYMSVCK